MRRREDVDRVLRFGCLGMALCAGLSYGCDDPIVDPRQPGRDGGTIDVDSDAPWSFDTFPTCGLGEKLCSIEGQPCEPLDEAGFPPLGCGPKSQCVDAMTDNKHCGDCDHACNPDKEICQEGQCACKDAGTQSCGSETCINLDITDWHCGECGHPCGAGENCKAGSCHEAPGDQAYSPIPADPLAPIELNGTGEFYIVINNYGRDEPSNPATGDLCSDAGGPDVFFRVLIAPPNPGAQYDTSISASVDKPGYAVAIWAQGTATGSPAKCVANELNPASASVTWCMAQTQISVMVRKLYTTAEAGGTVKVTISSSAGNFCISP
ncbi:MAG: hypothetical protein H6714_00620 [Myxococcales bacterium]|nr:hypothetical protein [Myxococcales bacterium]